MVGLVTFTSNAQIDANEAALTLRNAAFERQSTSAILGLAAHVRSSWEAARDAKQPIERQMLKALRQRKGEYESDKLSAIRSQGGSEIYMMLTETKCRGAESWLRDILLDEGMVPFGTKPTPNPELPPDFTARVADEQAKGVIDMVQSGVSISPSAMEDIKTVATEKVTTELMEEATKRAERMYTEIRDQFVQGGMLEAFDAFISDLSTYPLAVLKGPTVRRVRSLVWAKDAAGAYTPKVEERLAPTYSRVDPYRFYVEPGITKLTDGYTVEHHKFSDADLSDLIGVPGYDEQAIRAVLSEGKGSEWMWGSSMTVDPLENKYATWRTDTTKYDALEFWGRISGKLLREWGMDKEEIADEAVMYDANVWLIGNWVIKATLNYDPLGDKPYRCTSWIKRPGSFWGASIPELIEDTQSMCNASARALSNNMGIACLTADTVVYRDGTGNDPKRREVTIGELWESKHAHNSGLRRNVLRSLNETTGEFIGQRIKDIHFNGVRPVFLVTTEAGYTIKATDNHRFMSPDGAWRELESFVPGDLIAVNGSATSLADRRHEIRESHASVDLSTLPPTAVMTPEQAKVDHDTHYDRMRVDGKKMVSPAVCVDCASPISVRPGAKRCRSCASKKENSAWNMKWHAQHDNFGSNPYVHRYIDYDRVVSIEVLPAEPVYDLEMEAPHHNFIANGFVSHNSGPQVEVQVDRLAQGEKVTKVYPWKLWQTVSDPYGSGQPAIRFNQPDDRSGVLLTVYKEFARMADDQSGVPAYMYGDGQVGGAGRTSSGLSMLMGSAGKGIRQVVMHIDFDVVGPTVKSQYNWNMQYVDKPEIKGDLQVVPRGAVTLANKDQLNVRRMEFLQATANPIDTEILGLPGRAAILRESAKGLSMPVDDIIPSRDELKVREEMRKLRQEAQQAQQSQQPPRETQPDGSVKGGVDSRTSTSSISGQ